MTNDGAQVPYWLVDANGNNIVLGNTATMGTVYIGNVNALEELPFLNDLPPKMDKFALSRHARVQSSIWVRLHELFQRCGRRVERELRW